MSLATAELTNLFETAILENDLVVQVGQPIEAKFRVVNQPIHQDAVVKATEFIVAPVSPTNDILILNYRLEDLEAAIAPALGTDMVLDREFYRVSRKQPNLDLGGLSAKARVSLVKVQEEFDPPQEIDGVDLTSRSSTFNLFHRVGLLLFPSTQLASGQTRDGLWRQRMAPEYSPESRRIVIPSKNVMRQLRRSDAGVYTP